MFEMIIEYFNQNIDVELAQPVSKKWHAAKVPSRKVAVVTRRAGGAECLTEWLQCEYANLDSGAQLTLH